MSNLATGPKVRNLNPNNETIASLAAWQSTVMYGLRQNPEFKEYLKEGFVFGKKTKASPSRELDDIYEKQDVEVKVGEIKKVLVKIKSKEERAEVVDLILDQICNYCVDVIPRNDLARDCASLNEVWQKIRMQYNKQRTGSLLNDTWNIRRELDETPQALYSRIKQLYDDNLIPAGSLEHVDGQLNEDEEMSPTLLNTVILHWLQILHPELRNLVTQRFVTQLRNRTYAAIFPEISRSINTLLEELNSGASVNRTFNTSASNYQPRPPYRPPYSGRSSYNPRQSYNTNTYRGSNQYRPNYQSPRPNTYSTGRKKQCDFCKVTGKKMFYTHSIDECLFIKSMNEQNSTAVKHAVFEDEHDINHHYEEFESLTNTMEDFTFNQVEVEHIINRTSLDASPVLELSCNSIKCDVTLDTGAPCNLIAERKALQLNATIKPTRARVKMADGVTPLDVVGETEVTLFRKNKPYKLSAIVCRDTDSDILAGMPFMKYNDVAIRPFTDEIIIDGTEFIKYNPKGTSTAVKKFTVHTEKNQVVLPGESLKFTVPKINDDVMIEPRWDSSYNKSTRKDSSLWPQAHTCSIADGELTLTNSSKDPVLIRKSEPICSVHLSHPNTPEILKNNQQANTTQSEIPPIPVNAPSNSSPSSDISNPKVPKKPNYSESVKLNPDGVLNKSEEASFRKLLSTYDHTFSPVTSTYNGHSGPCYVEVNMGPNLPPQNNGRNPRFYGDGNLQELQERFDELKAKGVFSRPQDIGVTVENTNPSFLVAKPPPSKKKRLVSDFKSITSYCRPTPSVMPDVETTLRRVFAHKYQIKTDLIEAYYQLKLKKSSQKYCGVHTPYKGMLVYNVGCMGLPGVEVALEELTCLILGDLVKEGKVNKLADDLFIGGDTTEELMETLNIVLQRLQENNIKLNPTKTVIAPKSMEILGWIWSSGQLRASPHKMSALAACPPPPTVGGLRSFNGSYRYLSRLIKGYANIINPLEEAVRGRDTKELIEWTDALLEAFNRTKKSLNDANAVTVPRKSDQLSIITDASICPGAIGATLCISREGKRLLGGYFNSKLPDFQKRWLPCEVEALAIALSLNHYAPYIIQSSRKPQIWTDSKACVDAANKLAKGQFSTSARLSTFLSTVSRYGATIGHIPGSMNIISDYASRHPIQCDDPSRCAVCKFVSETMDSVVMNLSVEDIITGRSSMPWTNRRAWSEIQDECDTLRKVKFFRSKGTTPNRKSKNLRQVRRHMSAGTILSHDNLLVNPHTPPLGPVQERIVVPESVLHGLLTIMHLRLNHPSSHQLSKVFSRYFYGLCSDKVIKEVSNACPQCAAIRDVPTALSKESTEPPPTTVGGRFAADIIKRCKQKVFCIRETVTSYTQALLIPDETRESISNAIIRLCNLLRPSNESQITIRLDPAPAHQSLFQSLKSNSNLLSSNISLDIGRIFNKNKNPVIDKGIKELNREILVLQPSGGQVSQNVLSQAVANLNCRYRSTGMSSQELWTQRDQITGEQLPISDRDIILHQYQTRIKNHPYSEKCKAHGRPPNPTPQIKIGSLVYVYADRSKVNARQRYMVTAIQGENIKLKKFSAF